MKIIPSHNYQEMSEIAARYFAAQLLMKPNSLFGFATGSTPIGLYNELIKKYEEGKITFRYAYTVNLDEYYGMAASHEQSYAYFMNKNLFSQINIPESHTRLPDGLADDPDEECHAYDAHIASFGSIDMQLLGIGHNGHIGFNEPGDTFSTGTQCVTLSERTIEANKRFFTSADDVPRRALTMGMRAIMQAKKIVMVVSGADKAQILYETVAGPVTPKVPASILQLHPDTTIIVDEDAFSVLHKHMHGCSCGCHD